MQLILEIPAQEATGNRVRHAALFSCNKEGTLTLDARDGEKPPRFTLASGDNFPWDTFIGKLLIAWQIGDYDDIPPQFKPTKRIPSFVTDGLADETTANKLKILSTLRRQGYFPPLK